MSEAYSATGEIMAKRAKKAFALDLPPLVTGVALVATILFMVLGWYSEPSHILKFTVAVAVAVVTMLGIVGKRFHKGFEIGFWPGVESL